MDLQLLDLAKLLAAVAAGALIGLEREWADKPAGFRTNILICLGAALFTIVSIKMGDTGAQKEHARVAAQIVTGVGFLGAGAIVHFQGNVLGLTTAATIWAVASVGMAFGAGDFGLGIIGTLLACGVLLGLVHLEAWIAQWRSVVTFELEIESIADADSYVAKQTHDAGVRQRSWSVSKSAAKLRGQLTVVGPAHRIHKLQSALLNESSILALRRM